MKARTLASLLIAGAAFVAAPKVSAHGGIPRAYSVFFEPGNADHVYLRSDVWGLFRSTDGGQTWSWVCAETWGASSTETKRLSMTVLPGGTVLIANLFQGLQVSSSGDLCDFEAAPEFDGELVKDVTLVNDDGSLVYALTSTGGADGVTVQLWESTDQGGSWSMLGDPLPDDGASDFTGESVAVAPSDSTRVYVAGKFSGAATVQRSDDSGLTWQAFSVPAALDAPVWAPRIAGIDPTDPDVVYFWADGREEEDLDQMWMSTDGGATWELIVDGAGNLPGFSFSPDGATVGVSGPADGLLFAPSADLQSQGASAFTQSSDGVFFGLEWTDSGLYAGTNDFVSDGPRFTFGVSTDEGASFDGIMTICEPTLAACGPDTFVGQACGEHYDDLQVDMAPRCVGSGGTGGAPGGGGGSGGLPGGTGSAGEPGGGAGGGTGGGTRAIGSGGSGDASGCSCSAPGRNPSPKVPGVLALVGALAAARIPRRRRRPS